MLTADLEKMKLICSFVLSILLIVGSGYLALRSPETRDQLGVLIGGVVGYWFAKAPSETPRPANGVK